ncbi:type III restriction endonuclease subunit R [Helicobacter pylori]|uniref:type III restriction endonuclease subunit R n=1 Tax=Helicobacter pylori TaxID=210 RepID=UPI000EADB9EF|nr:type III restriction endonuclease subunit R [Helicobacter pylori]RKV29654.1 type III restriction endonuclease subunit R [Helicobacter pylori]
MIFIQARTSKINLKTLRYNFLTFSLRDFMQDSFAPVTPPPPISHKRSRAK